MLKAEALSQIYQERPVLRGFSFTFGAAGIYGIIGPNGAGKSTLLRLITGMEKPLSGRVFYRGVELTQPNPEIACVWQRPYLFQTTVAENIGYGLRIRHWARDARRVRVARLLQAFRLQPLANQAAPKLSVGEAARVALARAIAPRPQVLVMDEPAANLDPGNTRLVEEILTAVQIEERMIIILVTHDMFQAKRLAQTTLFLAGGELVESGPTERLFASPANARTRGFISGGLI